MPPINSTLRKSTDNQTNITKIHNIVRKLIESCAQANEERTCKYCDKLTEIILSSPSFDIEMAHFSMIFQPLEQALSATSQHTIRYILGVFASSLLLDNFSSFIMSSTHIFDFVSSLLHVMLPIFLKLDKHLPYRPLDDDPNENQSRLQNDFDIFYIISYSLDIIGLLLPEFNKSVYTFPCPYLTFFDFINEIVSTDPGDFLLKGLTIYKNFLKYIEVQNSYIDILHIISNYIDGADLSALGQICSIVQQVLHFCPDSLFTAICPFNIHEKLATQFFEKKISSNYNEFHIHFLEFYHQLLLIASNVMSPIFLYTTIYNLVSFGDLLKMISVNNSSVRISALKIFILQWENYNLYPKNRLISHFTMENSNHIIPIFILKNHFEDGVPHERSLILQLLVQMSERKEPLLVQTSDRKEPLLDILIRIMESNFFEISIDIIVDSEDPEMMDNYVHLIVNLLEIGQKWEDFQYFIDQLKDIQIEEKINEFLENSEDTNDEDNYQHIQKALHFISSSINSFSYE